MGTLGEALESIHSTKKMNDTPKSEKVIMIHYSKLRTNKHQYRNNGKSFEQIEQEIEDIAFEFRAVGKILTPCRVRKIDTDEYEVIGGHHRRDGAKLNVEKYGLKEFEFVPCIVEQKLTDAQAEYQMYSDNEQTPKTEWEIMYSLERRKVLIEEYPEDFPLLQGAGRIVEKLAAQTHMSKSTVGEYLQISKNLSNNAMESFKKGDLNKSAAVTLSSLPPDEQDKLIDAGITKQKDIKAYKKEEKVEKTTHRTTVTDTVKTVKTHNVNQDVPNFGTYEPIETTEVFPGQFRVVNTDMELEEEPTTNDINEESFKVDSAGRCTCPSCKRPSRIEDTFVFYGTRYCMNCLHKLIQDLEDTGVITLDRSSIDTNGIVVRS